FSSTDLFHEQHLLGVINLLELDLDDLAAACGHDLAHIGGLNGQLAMTAVNEHSQLHAARTAMIEERIQRSADGAAGIKHVVADDDIAAFDLEANGAGGDDGTDAGSGKIVAVELDVEHARFDRSLFDGRDELAEPLGERNSAALDADEGQVGAAVALFHDFVGQPHQRALDLGGRHQPAFDPQASHIFCLAHGCFCSSLMIAVLLPDDTRGHHAGASCGELALSMSAQDHAPAAAREKSPLLPPDLDSRRTSRMTMPLSSALVMS